MKVREWARHKATDRVYTVLGEAEAQVSASFVDPRTYAVVEHTGILHEGDVLVVYRDDETGAIYARLKSEFGERFEGHGIEWPEPEGTTFSG